jgi:hypothetical protein
MRFVAIRRQDGTADRYAIRSECGRYTVCKVILDRSVYFEAWRGCGVRALMLGQPTQDALEAKQLCTDDAKAAQLELAA